MEETGQSESEGPKHMGVKAAEEAARTIAGWPLWMGIVGISLVAYVYSLDNNSSYSYLTYGLEEFRSFESYTTIYTVQYIIVAVAKIPVAKLADVFGRAQAYFCSVLAWVIGFIILATSQRVSDMAGGIVLYAFGNTGVQIMQQIVIGDYTSSKWRGAVLGLVSMPFVVNFAIAPLIVGHLVPGQWRWGYIIFCIIAPIAAAPIIFVLGMNQRAATRKGLVPAHPYKKLSFHEAVYAFCRDTDIVGLFLMCAGFLLLLLPLNMAASQPQGWRTGWIIAALVLGASSIAAFIAWDLLFASVPVLNPKILFKKDVLLIAWISFFDFFSFYCSWMPAYTWAMIVKNWNATNANYFSLTQTLCLCVFGTACGFVMLVTKRYKYLQIAGASIRLLGIGLMIRFRDPSSSNFQVVIPQVLQGFGGGMVGTTLQVAAQVSVAHKDMAMVTAFTLLLCEIGSACGSAMTGAIQTNLLPGLYDKYLPMLDEATRKAIYSAPTYYLSTYPIGSAVRDGMIEAYNEFTKDLCIIGICLAAPPVFLSFFLTDRRLNNSQNCVDKEIELKDMKIDS
eukprot:Phypoly_transcript_05836.p1 GENE.Phypoly_transcript_05836~~Phypoly_transcript_05836.p1  ORF type:complete len:563 (-),score=76.57 Phypoly_transcript_05836:109-1797(-)